MHTILYTAWLPSYQKKKKESENFQLKGFVQSIRIIHRSSSLIFKFTTHRRLKTNCRVESHAYVFSCNTMQ